MTTRPFVCAIFLLSLASCTTTNGPGNGTDSGAASGASTSGGTTGGTTGGTAGSGAAAFVGTWAPTSGTTTINCPGQAPSTSTEMATLDFSSLGGGSSLQVSSPDCTFSAVATGNVASESPANQTCVVPNPNNGTDVILTYSTYTFTLSAGGTTATLSGQGTLKDTVNGTTVNCTFSESAQYRKN